MNKVNLFFKKIQFLKLSKILKVLKLNQKIDNIKLYDIKTLDVATKKDISFYNSSKYIEDLRITKSKYILCEKKYEDVVKKFSNPLVVNNTFKATANLTMAFYPNSLDDDIDFNLLTPKKTTYKNINFGNNVLIGKNIKIGKNCKIGHNCIIESNVIIGSNCEIGNNVILKKSIIGNNVKILDGAIVGKKGFGFFPNKNKNLRYPHIGVVIIGDNVEIGCNNTIDRGSLSNTVIGDNTFIDNQVHIAHNVKIGKNCIITAQVGFAGSSIIGDNVQIGGQAGISGHLTIGNNARIGGGSGVIKNIPENSKVMGYPAKDIRSFLKENN